MPYKVSVVIPVYNAEKHIEACIEALHRQTLRDCEFIFVDDGSTDGGAGRIERRMQDDPRIRLIRQANQGVSMARNAGLAAAEGEYIGFVDADDTVAPDMFETLYAAASADGCDVVISNFESELGSHKTVTRYNFPQDVVLDRAYLIRELLPYFIAADDLNTACTKLYRRELLHNKGIVFPRGVALGEDGLFNIGVLSHAASAKYIDYTGYYYRENHGSATRNIAEKDYFRKAVDVYRSDLPEGLQGMVDASHARKLKCVRLINTVLSIVHIYFAPSDRMSFLRRYRYVGAMIRSAPVREALDIYLEEAVHNLDRYQRLLVTLIQKKRTTGLFLAASYSRIRNK